MTPIDHPQRYALVSELHARPFPRITAPGTMCFVAFKEETQAARRDRGRDFAHLAELIHRYGGTAPEAGVTHWSGELGRHFIRWESHTEFVTYSAFESGQAAVPFDPAATQVFGAAWQDRAPGRRLCAVLVRIETMPEPEAEVKAQLEQWFVPESLAVARVMDAEGIVAGDFRIDPAGNMRFAVFVRPGVGPGRLGRLVQRICEIEIYRAMSMLGLGRARELGGRLDRCESEMSDLVDAMKSNARPAEAILDELLRISAELESMAVRFSYRAGATAAYQAIVQDRIEALREERFAGRQTFSEFMRRRYDPAMRTVKSSEKRLGEMVERTARAAELLRTRVDVERSAQNQKLLASMDKRSDLQLRLQATVEGLSVVAISYYAVSLVSYLLYPLAEGMGVSKGVLTAAAVPPVMLTVWLMIRRIHKRIH